MKPRLHLPGTRRSAASALAAIVLFAAACSSGGAESSATSPGATSTSGADGSSQTTMTSTGVSAGTSTTVVGDAAAYSAGFDDEDLDADEGASGATVITLEGTSVAVDGSGVTVAGTTITINAAGTFRLTGTLDDGQIVVDAGSDATVRLVLAGVDLTSSTSAPIYVLQAGRVIVTLAAGTDNSLTDAAAYVFPDAATD